MTGDRVVASIEARMGSSRLRGKVLADVGGEPSLSVMLRRLRRSTQLDDIVLATSTAGEDDVLEQWAESQQLPVYRGSEDDVLERVVEAHRMMRSDIIVEMTGDCTFADPELVDMMVATFNENACDVVTNAAKPSWPNGMDVQVFRFSDLADVAASVSDPAVREHVSLYFYEHRDHYRVIDILPPRRWWGPEVRIVLDYAEDLEFLNEIYRRLAPVHGDAFGIEEIMSLLRRQPQLLEINQHCEQKAVR